MGMGDAWLQGLGLLDPSVLGFLFLGVVLCQIVGVIPGLGGPFIIALLLPFTFAMDPMAAIAMLVGAAVTSGTGNSATAILLGLPGSSQGIATLFDGFPMAQKGQGGRALSAALLASLVGGFLGALVLGIMMPLVRPVVLAMGPAEFFVLILAALVLMSRIVQGDTIRALIAGGLGIGIATIGQEGGSGVIRYTFGTYFLWDGISIVPVVIGMFAIAEMISLAMKGTPVAGREAGTIGWAQCIEGAKDVVREWRASAISGITGVVVGLIPGLGGSTAGLLAYSNVAMLSKRRSEFGKGTVEGVIAADGATNSKEGAALVTTLAFGIPGSTTMALLLAAFIGFGIQPGTGMLREDADITWAIVWLLLLANVIATTAMLLASKYLAAVTLLRPSLIVAPVIVISLFGAYVSRGQIGDMWIAAGFGVVGWLFKTYGYPRVMLTIGFVLGGLLEHNMLLASSLYGWGFLRRPISFLLVAVVVLGLFAPPVWRAVRKRLPDRGGKDAPPEGAGAEGEREPEGSDAP